MRVPFSLAFCGGGRRLNLKTPIFQLSCLRKWLASFSLPVFVLLFSSAGISSEMFRALLSLHYVVLHQSIKRERNDIRLERREYFALVTLGTCNRNQKQESVFLKLDRRSWKKKSKVRKEVFSALKPWQKELSWCEKREAEPQSDEKRRTV